MSLLDCAIRLAFASSLVLVAGGCSLVDDDPDRRTDAERPAADRGDETDGKEVCGLETLPSPTKVTADACESGSTAVSETFTRSAGKPDTRKRTFTVDFSSELCLTVDNGGEADPGPDRKGPDGLAAAWIYVDDELVFGPDDFDPQTDRLRKTLDVTEGSHRVRVRLASKPGTSLELEARTAGHEPVGEPAVGDRGNLRVENIAVDHPLFSPNSDGYHDTATFNADNIPTNPPGESSGNFSYEIDWKWKLVDAESCETVQAGPSGTTAVNSPTNVQATWDGTDAGGSIVSDGNYLYQYSADLVRSDGRVLDSVTATARGLVVDTASPDLGIQSFGDPCDTASDPNGCKCPDQTDDGRRCTFAWIPNLTTFESPGEVDTSAFLTSHRDTTTGRWEVIVDLRNYNGGGLVPQHSGTYESIEQLRQYVAELTGVPADSDRTRLFNFDYRQLGYSTPVVRERGIVDGFNHFLLDALTDASGSVTIDDETIDLKTALRTSDGPVPEQLQIAEKRLGEECGYNGNTDGIDDIRAKSCTNLRTANLDPERSNLGIYIFKKRIFGAEVNGSGTVRDEVCIINGIYKCGVRTFQRDIDTSLSSVQYTERADIEAIRDTQSSASSLPAVVSHTDRFFTGPDGETSIIDGFCSEDTASSGILTAPLDSGAGALPGTCIINGIY